MWSATTESEEWFKRFLSANRIYHEQRVAELRAAEDLVFLVLEQVTEWDPRFLVNYRRPHAKFESGVRAAPTHTTIRVPLAIEPHSISVEWTCPAEDRYVTELHWLHAEPSGKSQCYVALDGGGSGGAENGVVGQARWASCQEAVRRVSSGSTHLLPGMVIDILKSNVRKAIMLLQQDGKLANGAVDASLLNLDGPSLCLLVRSGIRTITVTLVPVIHRAARLWSGGGGPEEEEAPWPALGPDSWLPRATVEEIRSTPQDVEAHAYYHWSPDFSETICKMLEGVDDDGGHRLDALAILDLVNRNHWRRKDAGGRLLTYTHLETVLLWALDFFPSPDDWLDLHSSVYRLLLLLLRCVWLRRLPHYFLPDRNLFGDGGRTPEPPPPPAPPSSSSPAPSSPPSSSSSACSFSSSSAASPAAAASLEFRQLYGRVEDFADLPERCLVVHPTQIPPRDGHRVDAFLQLLVQLPDPQGQYWQQGYFDVMLNLLQVYHINDKKRVAAMQEMWKQATALLGEEGWTV
uniref:Protein mab-21-like 4 n=1 Tax=Petromyzon marinus TaxID=7757 RepID=A0AAJ7TJF6_PETMA|nr:protein mab-21-like 4 [Petromyzon marinus]